MNLSKGEGDDRDSKEGSSPKRLTKWLTAFGAMMALSSMLVPGCKGFSSCEDTRSCAPAEQASGGSSSGGEGGAGGAEGQPRCDLPEVMCGGSCIDPETDVDFCGASGSCEGDEAGITCDDDEVCVGGACRLDCGEEMVFCEGTCIDPKANDEFCGVDQACAGGTTCEEDLQCVNGFCAGWRGADSLTFDATLGSLRSRVEADGAVSVAYTSPEPFYTEPLVLYTSELLIDDGLLNSQSRRDEVSVEVSHFAFEVNSAGGAILAWIQPPTIEGEPQLWASIRAPGGAWSEPEAVSGDSAVLTAGNFPQPAVSLDEEGNAYVAWKQTDGDYNRLWTNHRPAVDGNWMGPSAIDVDIVGWNVSSGIRIAPMKGGEALLVFDVMYQQDASFVYVVGQTLSSGGDFPTATMLENNLLSRMRIRDLASNGDGVAVLVGEVPGMMAPPQQGWVAAYQDGGWQDPLPLIDEETLETLYYVSPAQAVLDEMGGGTVVWREVHNTGGDRLRSISYPSDEGGWGAPVDVRPRDPSLVMNVDAQLALDGFGNVQLAWIEEGTALNLWTSRWRMGGTGWEEPLLVENLPLDALSFSLDFNDVGQGILSWLEPGEASTTIGYNYFN